MTGTIYHDLCPICGNFTLDRQDGECHYAHCDELWNDRKRSLPLDEQMDKDFQERHPDAGSLWD